MKNRDDGLPKAPQKTGEAEVMRHVQKATQEQLAEAAEVRREIDEKANTPMKDASKPSRRRSKTTVRRINTG